MAIKIIKRRGSLQNELNASNLSHPNVTKIKNVFERDPKEDTEALLVMEYVGQNNLQSLIEKNEIRSKHISG